MATHLIHNIVSIFRMDTFLASTSGLHLQEFMMDKHKWTKEQYREYLGLYVASLAEDRPDERILDKMTQGLMVMVYPCLN